MKTELITDAELDGQLNELAALLGREPDELLHALALEWTAMGIGTQLARARYHARMDGAHRKAFDYEAEAAHQRKAYAPIDWSAADRPPYTPIAWPTPSAQTHTKAGDGA